MNRKATSYRQAANSSGFRKKRENITIPPIKEHLSAPRLRRAVKSVARAKYREDGEKANERSPRPALISNSKEIAIHIVGWGPGPPEWGRAPRRCYATRGGAAAITAQWNGEYKLLRRRDTGAQARGTTTSHSD